MKHFTELKTFEQACKIQGLDSSNIIPEFEYFPKEERKAMQAMVMLPIIVAAANKLDNNNKKWVPNFNDNKPKYEPWFDLSDNDDGSSGFRYDDCDYWFTFSTVGSRLCFKTRECCEYTVNQFIDIYKAAYK